MIDKQQITMRSILALPIVFVLTVIVFFPTYFNDFQRSWDDNWQEAGNSINTAPII